MNKGRNKAIKARYREFTSPEAFTATLGATPPKLVEEFYAVEGQMRRQRDPLKAVALLYKYVDRFISATIAPASVCQKGCAWCCKIPVEVMRIEASFIRSRTGRGYNPFVYAGLPEKGEVDYCPMLDQATGTCSIYKARPLHCRIYHIFDHPKYCWPPDQIHAVYGLNGAEKDNPLIHKLATFLARVNISAGYGAQFADIRQWFSNTAFDNKEHV